MSRILKNQTITYITSILVDNYQTGYIKRNYLNISDKSNVLQKLETISYKYNAVPCTIANHIFDLKCVDGNRNENTNLKNILIQITLALKENQLIDITQFNKPTEEIIDLIDACNNLLCSQNVSDKVSKTYSDLQIECEKLKTRNNELEGSNTKLTTQVQTYEKTIEELKQQKQDYINFRESIFELVGEEQTKEISL